MQELTKTVRSLANGEAVGPYGVSPELFKITLIGDPVLRWRLPDIVVCNWRGGRCRSSGNMLSSWFSTDRRTGQCGKYRSISLVAHAGKILVKIIARRRSEYCEGVEILPEEQSGFQPNRSTTDIMLFVIFGLQQSARRKRIMLHVCFIGLAKAYDSVHRPSFGEYSLVLASHKI